MFRGVLIFSLALAACAGSQGVARVFSDPAPWAPPESAAGIQNDRLASLLTRYWAWRLERSPVWASELGVQRFADRISDISLPATEAERAENRHWLEEARALGPMAARPDATTLELLIEHLESAIASEVCEFEQWSVDSRSSPISEWNYLPELHRVTTIEDAENLLARYRKIPEWIDEAIAHLRRGAARGWFGNQESTRRVVEMVKKQLEQPMELWPLLKPVKAARPAWGPQEHAQWSSNMHEVVAHQIRPALGRYLETIEGELLPHARDDREVGIGALPQGAACYRARIRHFTNLFHDAAEIHALGQSEILRINEQMRALGKKLFGMGELPEILNHLRSDASLYFDSAEEIENKASHALETAKSRIPEYFGLQPKTDCVVTRVPDYEAPFTSIAYYRPPVPDGSKPGEYFVNVYEPKTRPRYEAAALAFHESIPGHHLQIAITQELPALPAFRKHIGMTAYVEGWALYAERLADEMGLYSDDLDRMGMLSYEAWRASRLVVDTGIHSLGWSRQQAIDYMLTHTALAPNNIANEVDRYITWPAQALAYKLGQIEILRLREWARTQLAGRFDIKQFHDAVLGGGAVTMPLLAERITSWVAAARVGTTSSSTTATKGL